MISLLYCGLAHHKLRSTLNPVILHHLFVKTLPSLIYLFKELTGTGAGRGGWVTLGFYYADKGESLKALSTKKICSLESSADMGVQLTFQGKELDPRHPCFQAAGLGNGILQ